MRFAAVLATVGVLAAAPGALAAPDTWMEVTGLGGDFVANPADGAGDVNADGHADLVFGRPQDDPVGRVDAGSAVVVFGSATPIRVDLAGLGARGFRIHGARSGDRAGHAVSAAGDVNADGRDDVVITAPGADNRNRPGAGSAYVVFGRGSSGRVDLAALGGRGFRIDGTSGTATTLVSAAGAGDVNGDGRDDVVVVETQSPGEPFTCCVAQVWVVYGKAASTPIDLRALGAGGYRVLFRDCDCGLLRAEAAGDVNGDGRDDIVLGNASSAESFARVEYGRASAAAASGGGFSLLTFDSDSRIGDPAAFGDVNRDGLADVGWGDDPLNARGLVVFGSTSPTDVFTAFGSGVFAVDVGFEGAGSTGFAIHGPAADRPGVLLGGAGDVDGDGYDDAIVTTLLGDAIASYVVSGRASTAPVVLSDGGRDARFVASGWLGVGTSAAGDVDGDGRADLLVTDASAEDGGGLARVVRILEDACTLTGTAGDDTLRGTPEADVLCGQGGNDTLLGAGGDDTLLGGAGADRVFGGVGADELEGDDGDDQLSGGLGDDRLQGEGGRDHLAGGSGADALRGGEDPDVLRGGAGADDLLGDDGNDRLDGGAEGDAVDGAGGNDTARGGAGHDDVHGGPGADLVNGDGANDVVRGGSGADRLLGADGADSLVGGLGPDSLSGGNGNDALDSLEFADFLYGLEPRRAEADTVACGEGADTLTHDGRDTAPADCETRRNR